MKWFTEPLKEMADYRGLLENIKEKDTPVLATGVIDAQKIQLIYALCQETGRTAIVISRDDASARAIYNDLAAFEEKTVFYPSKDFIFYSADVHSGDITRQRFKAMDSLMRGEAKIVCAAGEAVLGRLMKKRDMEEAVFELREGDIMPLEELTKRLVYLGYERSDTVEGPGQFAVRGGIADIYSPINDTAVRIEFWDDEVDSVRAFDVMSQRSLARMDCLRVFPVREILFGEEAALEAAAAMEKDMTKAVRGYEKKGFEEAAENLRTTVLEASERLKCGLGGTDGFINYLPVETVSLPTGYMRNLPKA